MPKISVAKLLWQSFRPKIPPSERRSPKSAAVSKARQIQKRCSGTQPICFL